MPQVFSELERLCALWYAGGHHSSRFPRDLTLALSLGHTPSLTSLSLRPYGNLTFFFLLQKSLYDPMEKSVTQ